MEDLRRDIELLKLAVKPRHQPSKKMNQAKRGTSTSDIIITFADTANGKRKRSEVEATQGKRNEIEREAALGPFKRWLGKRKLPKVASGSGANKGN